MTKLKNTKKGMAKKALSISLVAAMLATSNVPVWAAEDLFSDGAAAINEVETPIIEEAPEVDTFSAEAPADNNVAPVEDAAEASINRAVVESEDLSIDITIPEKIAFTGTVTVSGSIKDKTSGEDLTGYSYGWRVAGDDVAIYSGTTSDVTAMGFTADFADADAADASGKVAWDKYVDKTLELYIFKNTDSADNTKIDPTVIGTTTLTKLDMSEAVLTLDKTTETYNGKEFYLGKTTDTGSNAVHLDSLKTKNNAELNPDYFEITASGTALNAGDIMTVTATAKKDSPYSGTSKDVTFSVDKRGFDIDEFELKLTEGLTYQYTGSPIAVPAGNVSLKESSDILSGVDLSTAVVSAVTVDKNIGIKKNVIVTLDADELANFKNVPTTVTTSGVAANANVAITKRDIKNNVKVSINKGKVQKNTTIQQFVKDVVDADGKVTRDADLILTGTEGTALNLVCDQDYTITVINPENEVETTAFSLVGTYKVTIQAKEATNTCINGQTFEVQVAGNVISGVEYSENYEPYYTGEAIRPTQSDLGNLTIIGKGGDREKLQKDQWTITDYKTNINAGTAYAVVKIGGDSTYANQTVNVPYEIKPLTVSEATVTVPKTVTYNKGYNAASDYKVPLIVTAKDPSGKIVKGLTTSDYTVTYEYMDKKPNGDPITIKPGETHNVKHNTIKASINVTNSNFKGAANPVVMQNKLTEIVAKAVSNDMIKINPSSYTYTGGNIIPEYYVSDGAFVLYEGKEGDKTSEYEVVSVTNNLNVGTGKLTIKGINDNYSGTASANFAITAADTSSVKVEIEPQKYTGKTIRPRSFKATLNGNDVTSQFEIVSFGDNVEAGVGTVVLKLVDGNKNFVGSNITAEFKIYKEIVKGDISVYDSNGVEVSAADASFDFDGTAKTFATERLKNLVAIEGDEEVATKATAADFEIKYAENITGVPTKDDDGKYRSYNTAYVYAVAKDGTGYTGEEKITLADGTIIKNVVSVYEFKINNVEFVKQNVSVKNGVYAGGLVVKPEILIQIKGNTLVEGKDYKLTFTTGKDDNRKEIANCIDVTDGKVYGVIVEGIGGYTGSKVELDLSWGIDKKNIQDCDVKVVSGVTTVMNGYIPVPTTEYTVKENTDGSYTVTANAASKSYTGSKTVAAEGQKPTDKPAAPVIEKVNVVGNKATVILSGESDGATGYDYVISTDRDCITTKDYDKVNKNILSTNTTFTYTQQDVYYAYCHSWKRVDGKKVFSDWSNGYPFAVSAMTPDQPGITNVKVSGSTVTVTYTKSANATGYDIVLGSEVKKVNGENRPVNYGTLVKKITKGNTVTATFKNVKKGTYYAGLHAYNRTSEDGKKVFSPWSNTKKVTVK